MCIGCLVWYCFCNSNNVCTYRMLFLATLCVFTQVYTHSTVHSVSTTVPLYCSSEGRESRQAVMRQVIVGQRLEEEATELSVNVSTRLLLTRSYLTVFCLASAAVVSPA